MTDYSFEFTHAITRRPARSVVNGLRAKDRGTPDFDQMLKRSRTLCGNFA